MIHLIDESNSSEWTEICNLMYADIEDDLQFFIDQSVKAAGPGLILGCSTGRVVNALACNGKKIDAVDPSMTQIRIARDNLPRSKVKEKVNFIHSSFYYLDLSDFDKFGIVIVPSYGFMSITQPEEQQKFLGQISRVLSTNGILILDMEVPDPSVMLCDPAVLYHERDLRSELDSRVTLYTQRDYDFHSQIGLLKVVAEHIDRTGLVTKRIFHDLEFRYTFRWEMYQLLKLCGFTSIELFSDFDRGSFDENSRKMIWVAELTH